MCVCMHGMYVREIRVKRENRERGALCINDLLCSVCVCVCLQYIFFLVLVFAGELAAGILSAVYKDEVSFAFGRDVLPCYVFI